MASWLERGNRIRSAVPKVEQLLDPWRPKILDRKSQNQRRAAACYNFFSFFGGVGVFLEGNILGFTLLTFWAQYQFTYDNRMHTFRDSGPLCFTKLHCIVLSNSSELTPLRCAKGFYYNSCGVCLPSCHTWVQFSRDVSIAIDVIIFMSVFTGFVVGLVVLVMSILRQNQM